jgi:hypothetical protein
MNSITEFGLTKKEIKAKILMYKNLGTLQHVTTWKLPSSEYRHLVYGVTFTFIAL